MSMIGPLENSWGCESWLVAYNDVDMVTAKVKNDGTPVLIVLTKAHHEMWLLDTEKNRDMLGLTKSD